MGDKTKPIALVTGGAGFIGSHLCEALLRKGYAVRCFDDLSFGSEENITAISANPDFSFYEKDVCDISSLDDAARDTSIIFHLAARKIPRYGDALLTLHVNNEGTKNVLETAENQGSKVIIASTSDVYGKGTPPFRESDDLLIGRSDSRRWSYAASKIFDEHLALAYHDEKNVPVVILRFFGSYGPRHHRSWWGGPQAVFIDQILNDEEITIHGDGAQTRSFTYIDDLIDGIISASEAEEALGQIFNLGSDEEISILQLASMINELIREGQPPKIRFIPYESFGGKYEDVQRRLPDLTKAGRVLGYNWKTGLRDGLSKTIDWHRKRPKK